MRRQVCLTMPIEVFANVLLEGSYQRIDLELGKPHDEYENYLKIIRISRIFNSNNICL